MSVEERLDRLEHQLARLETRFETRVMVSPDADLGVRLSRLERTVATLNGELTRLQRQIESATREAADARREARNAEALARQNAQNLSRPR